MNLLHLLNLKFLNNLSISQKTIAIIRKIVLVIRLLFTLSTHLAYLSHLSHLFHSLYPLYLFYLSYLPLFRFISLLSGLFIYFKFLINHNIHSILMMSKFLKLMLKFLLDLYMIIIFK